MLNIDDIRLDYDDGARSVHTLLRIIDADDPTNTAEMLFDNLTTPMHLIVSHSLRVRQESFGFQSTAGAGGDEPIDVGQDLVTTGAELLAGWRELVSGSKDEALIVECYGAPSLIAAWIAA